MSQRRASAATSVRISVAAVWLGALLSWLPWQADAENPLAPVDTSSPRATLESFLSLTDETARRYEAFREKPNLSTERRLMQLMDKVERLFDLSGVAPATRKRVAARTYYLLWDVVAKVELPDPSDIPGAAAVVPTARTGTPVTRWRIPGTDITIARVAEGDRAGEFLFSPDTVARARHYYEAARSLPYLRSMRVSNVYRIDQTITGWMIPPGWVDDLPAWANEPVAGQVLWKWLATLLLFGLSIAAAVAVCRLVMRRALNYTLASLLRHLSTPLVIYLLNEALWLLLVRQINVTGAAAPLPDILRESAFGLAIIWAIWVAARWVGARIVRSPRIASNSLRANLTTFAARSVGLLAALIVVFRIAQDFGVPVYGLIAGAGVGGVAIALAVRSTLENVIGTLNLYADAPIRVGDFCRYGDDPVNGSLRIGTIEEIGLRSTRIRGVDRSITTIPNADFANMHLVNLTRRDRLLLSMTLGLRYETTAEQLQAVLTGFREKLLTEPHVDLETAHVRVTGFGTAALQVAVFAYVLTPDWNEFLGIQEELIIRFLTVVDEAGTGLALPSTIVYRARDPAADRAGQEVKLRRRSSGPAGPA